MNRKELQDLSRLRRQEAAVLLKSRHYPGAYYLLGYSVEFALKAAIAKQTKKHDFPNKALVNKAYTHNLENLLKLAELQLALEKDMKENRALELNWAVVKDWTEQTRYQANILAAEAKDLYSACSARKNGILPWIRVRW